MADHLRSLFYSLLAAVIALVGAQVITPKPPVAPPPTTAPATPPKPEEKPTANPIEAIGRIQVGQNGCTATVIGPRRADGRWNFLTAAHCVSRVGESGVMRLRDGRTVGFVVAAVDRQADACWLLSTDTPERLPWLHLADTTPPAGTKVFHAGFGVDQPANREDGEVKATMNADGQSQYWLSVSPGDSGGGICLDNTGRVVSPVCCTTKISAPGDVWGASPERCRKLLQQVTTVQVFDGWTPAAMPAPRAMPTGK